MTATLNPAGASVIYAWKVGGYQVSNAATYTVTANDVGKQIELIVTGTGVYSGTQSSGLTAAVSASRAIADVVIRNDTNPTTGAAPSVGDRLTAVPSPAQATVTYQWKRDGAAISGATAASYTVAAEDEGHKLSVTVTGTGSYSGSDTSSETATVVVKAPVLGLIVPTFAEVVEGYEQPAAAALSITNTGSAGATITGVTSSDPARFIVNTNGSSQIAAGARDTSWTIRPAAGLAAGTYGATVTVTYDGGKTVSSPVSFVVKGSAPAPASELVIGNVAFDPLEKGYSVPAAKNFTVSNTGNADVTVNSAALIGKNPDAFVLGGVTTAIKAGETASYSVQPAGGLTEGTYTATLVVTYDGGKTAQADVSFTVTQGVVTEPSLEVGDVNFGSVVKGSALDAQSVSITNIGGSTATITRVYLSGTNADSFTVNDNGSTQIAVGGPDASWKVQPNAGLEAGTYSAQINVEYNGSASPAKAPVTLTVTKSGTPSTAELTLEPVTVSQPADNLSPVTLTIMNNSDVEAVIESVKVSDETNFTTNYDGSTHIAAHGEDKSWKVMLTAAPAENTYNTNAIVVYNSGAGTESKAVQAVVTVNVTRATQTGLSEVPNADVTTGDVVDGMMPTGNEGTTQPDFQPVADPAQQTYTEPVQDTYTEPVQDTYTDPVQDTYTEPVQETHTDPVQDTYTDPVQDTYTEPVQETYTEPAQEPVAEPEPQAPAAAVLTIQSKSSVTKGKTLQLTALMNDQAIVYDSNNDEAYPILWTLSGAKSKGTSISASGLLTVAADETATSLTVTATLKSDQNNFSTVNLKVKEAQTTETANTTTETVVNDDGTNDAGMEPLDTLLNP